EIENGFLNVLPRFYPGLYDDFMSALPESERAQPLQAYFRRILDANPDVNIPAARAWGETERILSEHTPNRTRLDLPALGSTRRTKPNSIVGTTANTSKSAWRSTASSKPAVMSRMTAIRNISASIPPKRLRCWTARPIVLRWQTRRRGRRPTSPASRTGSAGSRA